jgi:WD40 repeat protein
LTTLSGPAHVVSGVAFSPDGARLVTFGPDLTVRVWTADQGHEVFPLATHTAMINAASISPDGHRLATASSDGAVHVHHLSIDALRQISKRREIRALSEPECRKYLHQACPARR